MSKLLTKMNELAGMASSTGALSADRENYQAAFAGFVDDFEKIQNETFNDKSIFGNTMGDEEKQLLESLKTHWLAATEKLVLEEYGWRADSSDSWDLVIEENGATGGSAAFVRSGWTTGNANPNDDYASQVKLLSIDLPDLTAPHTVGNSTADTLIAHEMVHLLQAQNTYMGDQAGGDPDRDMTWLAEGLAEFIRGADYRASSSITNLGGGNTGIDALLQMPNQTQGWQGGSNDYAAAYLAVKYLDERIRNHSVSSPINGLDANGNLAPNSVDTSDGIKHLTSWMRNQRVGDQGASSSGLDQYFSTFSISKSTGGNYTDIDDFFTDLQSGAGRTYVNTLDLTDDDTGSVHGSEYGGTAKDSADVVRDDASYLSGFTSQLTYEEEEVEDPEPIELGGGVDLNLSAINPVSFGDTSTYNLETESGAKLVMDRVDELIEIITNSLAQVGSNMGAIERSANIVSMRQSTLGNAISRVNEVSLPEESMHLAKSDILINSNLMMRAQSKAIQQDVMLTLIS